MALSAHCAHACVWVYEWLRWSGSKCSILKASGSDTPSNTFSMTNASQRYHASYIINDCRFPRPTEINEHCQHVYLESSWIRPLLCGFMKILETVLITIIFTNNAAYIQKHYWYAVNVYTTKVLYWTEGARQHFITPGAGHTSITMKYKETIYCQEVMGHFLWCTAVCPHLSDSSYNVAQKSRLKLCLARLIVNCSITLVRKDASCLCPHGRSTRKMRLFCPKFSNSLLIMTLSSLQPRGNAERELCICIPDGLIPLIYVDGDNDSARFCITISHNKCNEN